MYSFAVVDSGRASAFMFGYGFGGLLLGTDPRVTEEQCRFLTF